MQALKRFGFFFREWSSFKFYMICFKTILLLFLLKIAYSGSPNYLSVLKFSVEVEIKENCVRR